MRVKCTDAARRRRWRGAAQIGEARSRAVQCGGVRRFAAVRCGVARYGACAVPARRGAARRGAV
eukprot:1430075-Prymnesium_polylepis.2